MSRSAPLYILKAEVQMLLYMWNEREIVDAGAVAELGLVDNFLSTSNIRFGFFLAHITASIQIQCCMCPLHILFSGGAALSEQQMRQQPCKSSNQIGISRKN